MTTQFPLLVSAADLTPGEPNFRGSNKACITSSASSVSFNPATYIPTLQDGDYVVIVQTYTGLTQGAGGFTNANWAQLVGPAGDGVPSVRSTAVMARFWNAASPSDTMAVDTPGGSWTICFSIYAWRGVSRRKPINSPYVTANAHATSTHFRSHYWPASRASADPDAYMLHVVGFEENLSQSGPPASAIESRVLSSGQTLAVNHNETGAHHIYSIAIEQPMTGLRNVLGSNNGQTLLMPGFTLTNMTLTSGTSGNFDRSEFYATNRSATVQKYMQGSIVAEEGDVIVFEYAASILVLPSSSDSQIVLTITSPSGVEVGEGFDNVLRDGGWDGELDGDADYYNNDGTSGNSAIRAAVIADATEAGTYTLRCYIVREGDPLSWRVTTTGTDPITIICRYLAAGAALNAPPFIEETTTASTVDYAQGDYAGGCVFRIPSIATTFPATTEILEMSFQIILADATLIPTQLRPITPAFQFTNATRLEVAGSNQPYATFPGTWVYSDSVVLPTYRLTELGADTTGQYYMEVTVTETSSDASQGFGIVTAAAPISFSAMPSGLTNSVHGESLTLLVGADGTVRENNNTVTTTSTMSVNDVYGFAIDYSAKTIGLYKNGSLIHTASMAIASRPANLTGLAAYRFTARYDENSATDIAPNKVNFRGPFTYAKPSGFVAWDFHSELT